ncbi:hypothetical protein D3C78_1788690 [compost metagenome]
MLQLLVACTAHQVGQAECFVVEFDACSAGRNHVARFLQDFFQCVADDQVTALHYGYVDLTLFGDGRANRGNGGTRLQPLTEQNGLLIS